MARRKYDVPDEHLTYSELVARLSDECIEGLPEKERILLAAKKLEADWMFKETICDQICKDLENVTSVRHIQRCLPDEYKQRKRRRVKEESTGELATSMSPNDDKRVSEQKTVTVDTEGYEQPFEEADRGPNVQPASEIVDRLKKKLNDITSERDTLSTEVQTLKEKSQPELLKELQDKFYDQPGIMDAKQLQKVSLQAGRELETYLRRFNTIIKGAVDSRQPVPMGLYIIVKPDMKLVPVRVMIDFDKRTIDTSLWEKKLTSN